MIRWLARLLLFRILPRRILPILTFIELARLAWGLRPRRYRVNEPWRSRTAQPPVPPTSAPPQRRR
jgi:hypothetical protein